MVALATWGECSGFQDLERHPIHKIYKIWCFKNPGPTATCSLMQKVFFFLPGVMWAKSPSCDVSAWGLSGSVLGSRHTRHGCFCLTIRTRVFWGLEIGVLGRAIRIRLF